MNNINTSDFLFVYGLLQSNFNNPYADLLKNNAANLGKGYCFGRLYEIDGYPGLIIDEDSKDQVYGTIYQIKNQAIFSQLDLFEGIGERFSKPYQYMRIQIKCYQEMQDFSAWAYVYNWSVNGKKLILSGDYLEYSSQPEKD